MTHRVRLLVGCVAYVLLACGGEAKQAGAGGTAGSQSAAGGQTGPAGGSANGGTSNGGTSNGGSGEQVCCNAFPSCPSNERQASAAECPGPASCHEVSICCSTIWCVESDGSGGAASSGGAPGSGGAATHDCNGLTCSATQACIAYRTVGGVFLMPDGGACPTGRHVEGNQCVADFRYQCAELHGACQNQTVTCACAQPPANSPGVCPTNYGSCTTPDATDAPAQLICQQLAP